MIIASLFGLIALVVFFFCSPSIISEKPIFNFPRWLIITLVIFSGVSISSISPLIYELGVELTYPVSEGIVSGFLTTTMNLACLVFLIVTPNFKPESINFVFILLMGFCLLILLFIKEEYRRVNIEEKKYTHIQSIE